MSWPADLKEQYTRDMNDVTCFLFVHPHNLGAGSLIFTYMGQSGPAMQVYAIDRIPSGDWLGLHRIITDLNCPLFTTYEELLEGQKRYGLKVGGGGVKDGCDCTLVGAHELWCSKWEAY